MRPTLIITGIVVAVVALGVLFSSGSSSTGYSSYSDYSGDPGYSYEDETGDGSMPWSAYEVFTILSGVALAGAVAVPSMPNRNRALLAGGAAVAIGYGLWVHVQTSGTFRFPAEIFILPFLVTGWAIWGWCENLRRGEGSRPGDDGDLVFPPVVRHQARAAVGLEAEVETEPRAIVAAVARALADRGNYFTTDGCAYSVLAHRPDGLDCAVVSGRRGRQQCTFSVRMLPGTPHRLHVRLGEYRTVNEKIFFIPMGPASIPGYASYRHFLRSLSRELRTIDPGRAARVTQGS